MGDALCRRKEAQKQMPARIFSECKAASRCAWLRRPESKIQELDLDSVGEFGRGRVDDTSKLKSNTQATSLNKIARSPVARCRAPRHSRRISLFRYSRPFDAKFARSWNEFARKHLARRARFQESRQRP